MQRILVLGAGADASGGLGGAATEALLALKAAGVEVVLLDSNPTTLATDADVAHRTYLEPVTLEAASRILALEKPQAVLAMLGGEVGLKLAGQLAEAGQLQKFGVKLLGLGPASLETVGRINAAVDVGACQGWRQAELLVLRDRAGAAEVAATVEFLEPVGVHPSDSVAFTPAQTFSPEVLGRMEALAISLAAQAGVEGVCSARLAVDPAGAQVRLLELWPALPPHTALVTRGSGRPIAVEAAGLLVGAPLVPRARESALVGLALRAPRFDLERFGAAETLGAQSQSTGEVVAIGAGVGEVLLRALHALDAPLRLGSTPATASHTRWQQVLGGATGAPYAPQLLSQLAAVAGAASQLKALAPWTSISTDALWAAKRQGFSDLQLAGLWGCTEAEVRALRAARQVRPALRPRASVYSLVYDGKPCELPAGQRVLLLGGGARRVGQGGEVEWSCAHAARGLRASGKQVVLLDCTPAVSSADFDRVCLGALAREEVLELCALLKPQGVLAQFGGPFALELCAEGVPLLGTSAEGLLAASDRARFSGLVESLGLSQPLRQVARTVEEARAAGAELGYPLLARTSRGSVVVQSEAEAVAGELEQFLSEATEVEVELLRDHTGEVVVAAVLEHVEQAGIHSGDAAFTLPPHSLSAEVVERVKDAATALAGGLRVVGLLNLRFAVQGKTVRVLEANPRVSRAIPFVAKATGMPLVELSACLGLSETLAALGSTAEPKLGFVAVKEAVFPFARFPGSDVLLGTQMKSTGEVMALSVSMAEAFGKSQLAAGTSLPRAGKVFLSVQDDDKPAVVDLCKRLKALGFSLLATEGTHAYLSSKRVEVARVAKVSEGGHHIGEQVREGEVALIIYTVDAGRQTSEDGFVLRREAVTRGVPHFTTVEAARLAVGALEAQAAGERQYRPLQDWLELGSRA